MGGKAPQGSPSQCLSTSKVLTAALGRPHTARRRRMPQRCLLQALLQGWQEAPALRSRLPPHSRNLTTVLLPAASSRSSNSSRTSAHRQHSSSRQMTGSRDSTSWQHQNPQNRPRSMLASPRYQLQRASA
jgi:hypothetical protein